jgi:hypothetical protein
MNTFPRLAIRPGEYPCEWVVGSKRLAGGLELRAGLPPVLAIYGDLEDHATTATRSLPERHEYARLVGRLRSNLDVVLTEAALTTWFPGQTIGLGRYAIVGLGVDRVPDDEYERIQLQITGSDLLFGVPPLSAVSWPANLRTSDEPFSASFNKDSRWRWRDDGRGIVIDCGYETQVGAPQPYHFEVAFAPTIDFVADTPTTLDAWVSEWVQPLVEVTSLATGMRQRLSWLRLEADDDGGVSSVAFGGGIDQAPFRAEAPDMRDDRDRRPLFTLAQLPTDFPGLLRSWGTAEASENPFLELCRLAVSRDELPPRARFLYLVQALEALHSFENQANDARTQATFEARREDVLEELEATGLSASALRFIKRNWSKQKLDSLDRRLRALLRSLPRPVRDDLLRPEMEPIVRRLEASEGADTLEAQVRVLRNHLSHGSQNYSGSELRPWVRALEIVCRAHLLRLIGFEDQAIETAFRRRT